MRTIPRSLPTGMPTPSFDPIDRPREVRRGEELDRAALRRFLAAELPPPEAGSEAGETELEIDQFPSGFSNLTYRLRWGDRELVLRRGPFGSTVRSAHDMEREHRILSRLSPAYPKAPRTLFSCTDPEILGAPFYGMERVRGQILRGRMPGERHPSPERMRTIAGELIDTLAELHAVDWRAAGLGDLGKPDGYARRQIDGWTERYRRARTDDVPEMERVAAWLDEREPQTGQIGAALIHNDFKHDNLVLDPDSGRAIAVLDWEMATVGDPRMDLGTTLGYWVEPGDPAEMQALGFGPTLLPGNPTRTEVVERYAAASGRDLGAPVFWYAYGLFKIATIVQQIYARYRAGYTRDPRFADLDQGVRACARAAWRCVQAGSIDPPAAV